ncbi:Catabolite repressor/activator [Chromobacterium violaceum]|uniref:Catabolite repressor/activator n=1 Tax=Chromobacterium violaceum TaxID=536 RepID=A0A3S4I9B3_CHRVL|nr:Catabolite repressor/activator [Chromobacterium violaceum]
MSSFKRLTIDDIAALAGVSRTTASMVLNGHAERYRISPATVEKVERVAREHHFKPSQQARSLRSRRSSSIGLVVPDLTNSTHAALAQALENRCRERGYQLLMVTSDEDPERESDGIGQLAARQVDGMIVVPCSGDAARYQPWTGRLPFVFADRHIPGSGIPSAVTDAGDSVARLLSPLLAGGWTSWHTLAASRNCRPAASAWSATGRRCKPRVWKRAQTGWPSGISSANPATG